MPPPRVDNLEVRVRVQRALRIMLSVLVYSNVPGGHRRNRRGSDAHIYNVQ